jgi:hypothetical protein
MQGKVCPKKKYGTLPSARNALPPRIVFATISTKKVNINRMSTELLSPEVESDLQDTEEDKPTKDLEQEIELSTLL